MGLEGLFVIIFFAGLYVVLSVRESIQRKTGLKDGGWPLLLSTIGFFVGLFLLILAVMTFYAMRQ
jgi:hypothetical protein